MSTADTNSTDFAGKPDRANCGAPYPQAVKGCREYVSADVVAAIDIRVKRRSPLDCVPPTGPGAGKARSLFLLLPLLRVIGGQRVPVEKAGFTGIGFFREDDPDTHGFGFVGQQLDEPGVRQLDKRLVVLLAQVHLLLPERVLADDQGANAFAFQELNDPTADGMQLLPDPSVVLRRDRLQETGGMARMGAPGKPCLGLGALFVVPLT